MSPKKEAHTPPTLEQITERTLANYESRSKDFWEGTRDHDVTQNYQAFLGAMAEIKGLKILDFGCGPGRDLIYFKAQGHQAIGLDGSPSFCAMAREHSGCEVWQQNFLNLDLPPRFFDGIFANASLFHVPSQEMERVLKEFHDSLKAGGILFSSNPRGSEEGWLGERYGYFMEMEVYAQHLQKAGFEVLKHYYRPTHKPPEEQVWLAVVAKKLAKTP